MLLVTEKQSSDLYKIEESEFPRSQLLWLG